MNNVTRLTALGLLAMSVLIPARGLAYPIAETQAYCSELGNAAMILAEARDRGASEEDLLNATRARLAELAGGDVLKLTSADMMAVLNFAYNNPQLNPANVGNIIRSACYERFDASQD